MFTPASRAWKAAVVGLAAFISVMVSMPARGAATLTAEQLEALVAPIALYPDPLVAQILMAATYPLEVVQADRWLQLPENATLTADALTAALQQQPWDPSVKSLVAFPQLLRTMDTNLDWTEQLGDAFLAQQADVMDAIARLRQRAQATGALASTPQQTVATEDQAVTIEPANPDVVYIPTYNPWCIYGAWPYAGEPPFYFGSWDGSCAPADSFLAWGEGIYPAFGFWGWGYFDWRRHHIRIDHDRYQHFHAGREPAGGVWQHDPAHRHGIPYRDPATAQRFLGPGGAAQREFRGFAPAPAAAPEGRPAIPSGGRGGEVGRRPVPPPTPRPAAPRAFESFGAGAQVRGEAARGFSSRMAPVPSFHAAPAPSFHAAPSFHGGGFGGRR